LELGVIPPYKGRVSSTGLAKDGWITGLRLVLFTPAGHAWDVVVGDLSDFDRPGQWQGGQALNYAELEFTSNDQSPWRYELAAEYLLDDRFIRTELRYQTASGWEFNFELVNRFSASTKMVAGLTKTWGSAGKPTEIYAYYSYVPPGFGQRAELTEDFVDYGHSWVMETDTQISSRLSWFTKTEHVKDNWRLQLGLSLEF